MLAQVVQVHILVGDLLHVTVAAVVPLGHIVACNVLALAAACDEHLLHLQVLVILLRGSVLERGLRVLIEIDLG